MQYTDEEWNKSVEIFAAKIKELFNEEKIILIKNMPARYFVNSKGALRPYYSKDHFDSVMLCDLLLEKLNKHFIEVCPKCNVIEIPPYAIGSQKHKWGNHPFHFTEVYYDYLFECVDSITDGKKIFLRFITNIRLCLGKNTTTQLKLPLQKATETFLWSRHIAKRI